MLLNRFPFLTKEVKVRSKVNKFPSNTDLIPSLINTSYQIELAKPHLENKCFFRLWYIFIPKTTQMLPIIEYASPPLNCTLSVITIILITFVKKKIPLQTVRNSPTMMRKEPPFPPQLKKE
jgi:hypothetical protein